MTPLELFLVGTVAVCAFLIGRELQMKKTDEVIESTIDTLIAYRYLRTKTNEDGEQILLKVHEDW